MQLVPLATLPPVVPGSNAARVHPAEPVRYPAMLRGVRNRWWKPIVALLVFLASFVAVMFGVGSLIVMYMLVAQVDISNYEAMIAFIMDTSNPTSLLIILTSVIAMLPCAYLGQLVAFGQRPGSVHSVKRRMRWDLMGRLTLAVLPIWGAYLVGTVLLTTDYSIVIRPDFLILLVVILVFVPLQSATEEIVFRGAMIQSIGSWFKSPVAAMVVGGLASTAIFVPLHGSADIWLTLELSLFAFAAVYLTWKTGGLEAAIVFHAVNNTVLFLLDGLSGGTMNSLAAGAASSPVSVLISAVSYGVIVGISLLVFRGYQKSREKDMSPVRTPEHLTEPQMMQVIQRVPMVASVEDRD